MTRDEAEEFFRQVLYKRIYFSGWGVVNGKYFIPETINLNSSFFSMSGKNELGDYGEYPISDGFDKNDHGHHWYMIEHNSINIKQGIDFIPLNITIDKIKVTPSAHKCHCPIEVWLHHGCQCGGI